MSVENDPLDDLLIKAGVNPESIPRHWHEIKPKKSFEERQKIAREIMTTQYDDLDENRDAYWAMCADEDEDYSSQSFVNIVPPMPLPSWVSPHQYQSSRRTVRETLEAIGLVWPEQNLPKYQSIQSLTIIGDYKPEPMFRKPSPISMARINQITRDIYARSAVFQDEPLHAKLLSYGNIQQSLKRTSATLTNIV